MVSIMDIKKMKFEKITNGDIIEYKINNKIVDENTYNILVSDDAFITPPLPKIFPEEYKNIEFNVETEECQCEECQEIRLIVQSIQELDEDSSFHVLVKYLDKVKTETTISTMSEVYSILGSDMMKSAARLDNTLEDYRNSYNQDEFD